MKNFISAGLALGLLAVASASCSAGIDDDVQENTQNQAAASITLDQAKQTAETAQNGTAIGINLDEENRAVVYEVEFVDTNVLVDASTGEILGNQPNDDSAEDAQYQSLATITLDQAKQTAEAAQGETAIGINLGEEDNSLVYEVKFVAADVFVDAGTGDILATELENDSTDARIQGSIQLPND